jgi:hypothetical protein
MSTAKAAPPSPRRVYKREFCERLGVKPAWFDVLRGTGVIPAARRDPGCKRLWWTDAQVDAVILGEAVPTTGRKRARVAA